MGGYLVNMESFIVWVSTRSAYGWKLLVAVGPWFESP